MIFFNERGEIQFRQCQIRADVPKLLKFLRSFGTLARGEPGQELDGMIYGPEDQLRSLLLEVVKYQELGLGSLKPQVQETYKAIRDAARRLSRRLGVSYPRQLKAARIDYHAGDHRKVHSQPPKGAPTP